MPYQQVSILAAPTAEWPRIVADPVDRSRPWRNAPFVLFLACILAYGVFFGWYLLSRFDLLNIIRDVNWDDSFYYFQIARNMAAGQFSTFDGGITQTNGYHPLWLLLITPFYWLMDAETALFGIKGFEILLIAGAVVLMVAAARITGQPWLLLFAVPPMLYRNPVLYGGLEASAALFMLGMLFLALGLYARQPLRWQWLLAAVASALPWARLEYVAISLTATAALGAALALRQLLSDRATAGPVAWRSPLILAAAAPFLAALAGILLYFAYNWLVFGGLVPVSGAVKAAWSQNMWEGSYHLLENFRAALQIPAFGYELLVALEVCVYAPLIGWLARRAEGRQDWLLLAFLVGAFSLGVGHIAKFAQTVLTVHPSLQGQFPWYFVPAYLLTALIIPVRCCVVIYLIRRYIGSRWRGTARLLSLGVAVVGIDALLARADFAEPFRFVERSSNSIAKARWAPAVYMGTQVSNRILPEGSVVGSWDSGLVGYFSRFPVVNLDGVANSYDFLRTTNAADAFGEYAPNLRPFGITHFVNLTPRDFENALYRGTLDDGVGKLLNISVATEPEEPVVSDEAATAPEDVVVADLIWKKMASHFDYLEEDVGLMVSHRVGLALARNCRPEDVIVWSWDVPGQATPAVLPGKTRVFEGLCVSEVVLPTAVPVKSVRAAARPARDYLAWLRAASLPVIRSQYDVYVTENHLVYTKAPCAEDDLLPYFLLHIYPADTADLTALGFNNLDFDFRLYGTRADGVCLASVPLPGYAVAVVRTGQYTVDGSDFHNLWVEETRADLSSDEILARVDPHKAARAARDYLTVLKSGRAPVIRSDYDVYLVANNLLYVKEQCQSQAAEARFFLHVFPSAPADLPGVRGFENKDFELQEDGVRVDGMCLANIPLPSYDIARIRTGQFVVAGGDYDNLWEGAFRLR